MYLKYLDRFIKECTHRILYNIRCAVLLEEGFGCNKVLSMNPPHSVGVNAQHVFIFLPEELRRRGGIHFTL